MSYATAYAPLAVRFIVAALCFASLSIALKAQPVPDSASVNDPTRPVHAERLWLAGGMGLASGGIGLSSHWTLVTGRHVYSLRAAASANPIGDLIGTLFDVEEVGTVLDFGLLYGRPLIDRRDLFVSVGAGVSGVQRAREDAPVVLGLPIEVQASIRVLPWLGVGGYGFANLNTERSFGGVTFELQAGWLW